MSNNTGYNYIGGHRSAAGTVVLRSVDATTGEALPQHFRQATVEEVDAAAKAAAAAFPAYRSLPVSRRAEFLEAIADELDALDDTFVATVCRETALPAARIQGERGRTSGQMRLFAKVLRRGDFLGARIDRAQPQRTPLPNSAGGSTRYTSCTCRPRQMRSMWRTARPKSPACTASATALIAPADVPHRIGKGLPARLPRSSRMALSTPTW